jgi:hypothetical protein
MLRARLRFEATTTREKLSELVLRRLPIYATIDCRQTFSSIHLNSQP